MDLEEKKERKDFLSVHIRLSVLSLNTNISTTVEVKSTGNDFLGLWNICVVSKLN